MTQPNDDPFTEIVSSLDAEAPSIEEDVNGEPVIVSSLDTHIHQLKEDFFEHLETLHDFGVDVLANTKTAYMNAHHSIDTFIDRVEDTFECQVDDQIRFSNVTTVVCEDGDRFQIDPDYSVEGIYQGLTQSPCFTVDDEGNETVTMQYGLYMAISQPKLVLKSSLIESEFDIEDDEVVFVSLHMPGMKVQKLEPVERAA